MASVSKLVTILEKKNVIISSAKMRWCRARELFGSQIPVTNLQDGLKCESLAYEVAT